MTYLLHISDLHLVTDPQWNNMKNAILYSVRETLRDVPRGKKLLVITGDFHNFIEKDYHQAEGFLLQLMEAMDIEAEQDVFVIPGNHDVTTADNMALGEDDKEVYIQAIKSKPEMLHSRMEKLLSYYDSYLAFVQRIKVYQKNCDKLPVSVHVRTWRNKLHLLHLNTVLIADGVTKNGQMTDVLTATSDNIREQLHVGGLPCIAMGHNSFFDLLESHQKSLSALFMQENISAYLCGDRHKRNDVRSENQIELSNKYSSVTIPNIVGYRGSADEGDTYSDFGMIWHIWDEETGRVTLKYMKWDPQDQANLQPDGTEDCYFLRNIQRTPDFHVRSDRMEDGQEDASNMSEHQEEEEKQRMTSREKMEKSEEVLHLKESGQEKKGRRQQLSIGKKGNARLTKKALRRDCKFYLLLIPIFIFVFLSANLLVSNWNQEIVEVEKQRDKEKPVEEVYSLVENENGLLELDFSQMNLSDISFLEQYDLSKVEALNLSENDTLQDVSVLEKMTNLKMLDLSETSVSDGSVIKGLVQLETLDLSDTDISDINFVESLTELKSLNVISCTHLTDVSQVSQLENLIELYISGCENDKIWRSLPPLPWLEQLYIGGYEFKGAFDFGRYPSLIGLNIYDTDVKDLSQLLKLKNLKYLNVIDTVTDFTNIEQFTELESLRVGTAFLVGSDKITLKNAQRISQLSKLKKLCIMTQNEKNLTVLQGMSDLEGLEIFASDIKINDFAFLKNNQTLQSLELTCQLEGDFPEIASLTKLTDLTIIDNRWPQEEGEDDLRPVDLSFLKGCVALERLELNIAKTSDISFLEKCESIRELELDVKGVKDLSPVGELYGLKKLSLAELSQGTEYDFLSDLKDLEELTIKDGGLASYYEISGLTKLKRLSLTGCTILNSDFLQNLTNLEYLDLTGNYGSEKEEFHDIFFVKEMKKLRLLNLSYRQISDFSCLQGLNQLLVLNLSHTETYADISVLKKLTNLNVLEMEERRIKSLKPLADLKYLGGLNVKDCSFGTDAEWDFTGFHNLCKFNMAGSTISSLHWLEKCNLLHTLDISHTMLDDLEGQLSKLIWDKEKLTITYSKSALNSGRLSRLKEINENCVWQEEE